MAALDLARKGSTFSRHSLLDATLNKYFWAEKMVANSPASARSKEAGGGTDSKRQSLRPEADPELAALQLKARHSASVAGSKILVNIVRALLARGLFVVHSLTTIWATVNVCSDQSIWAFALISVSIVIEGAYSIVLRAGDERKWFSPSVLLYVLATAPPIWLLEAKMCEWRRQANVGQLDDKLHFQLLEQLLLVVLIIGRWLLPKGEISREQLSQILLAYLAISSDIVEFFDVFKERVVYRNEYIQYIVLAAWTLSLLQFPFVLTVSRARKMRVALTKDEHTVLKRGTDIWQVFYDIDIWAIFLANSLQDIPFFAVRLYLMTQHRLVTYTMIFFICKNALIIALQTYRAFVLFNDRYLNPKLDESLIASVISGEQKHRSPNKKRKKPRNPSQQQQAQATSRHKKPRHSASSTEEGQKAPIVGFSSRRTSAQHPQPRGSAATIKTTGVTTPVAMKSPQHVTRASIESYTDLQ